MRLRRTCCNVTPLSCSTTCNVLNDSTCFCNPSLNDLCHLYSFQARRSLDMLARRSMEREQQKAEEEAAKEAAKEEAAAEGEEAA